jgi:ribose 5-phosphate isomerase RpiB
VRVAVGSDESNATTNAVASGKAERGTVCCWTGTGSERVNALDKP